MAQQFLENIVEGDKRILLVDGELLGVVGRVPSKGDLRSNVHVGGSAAPAELADADRKIIETISPRLIADQLFFVGLDVIGGKLIEVNTNETPLTELSDVVLRAPSGESLTLVVALVVAAAFGWANITSTRRTKAAFPTCGFRC